MFTSPTAMEPLYPEGAADLEDLALEVHRRSARLGGALHPHTLAGIAGLTRLVNSYYSNLIEGHDTHPVDIERAMRADWSKAPAKRALQEESKAHLDVQRLLADRLAAEPALSLVSADTLCWLHREFYARLPTEFRRVQSVDGRRELEVRPGALRSGPDEEVEVGVHIAPRAAALPVFLARLEAFFVPEKFSGVRRLIAGAALHHRLMWVHPFLDGNGRVIRLVTDAWLSRACGEGYGLWTVSRGLARSRERYLAALADADSPRRGDLDGRGHLSTAALGAFCRFFLDICLDQAAYMGRLLALDALCTRLAGYVEARRSGLVPGPTPKHDKTLKPEAAHILSALAAFGELARGDALRHTGLSERSARAILAQLLEEGLVVSASAKGPVRLGFPAAVAHHWFPDLYPQAIT
jgi:Fic family protein